MSSYVLEWSRKSNGFHIQPLESTLAGNQKCFMENTSHDYIVLMVGEKDVCERMADNWRSRLASREQRLHAVI
ncbi:MAG: hypothetical protein WC829_15340 [Hyphomicrobium sp.]|jgi:hypothetical protein